MDGANYHENLIKKIEELSEETGRPVTRFGIESINDPNLFSDLKAGRELRRSTERKVLKYLEGLEASEVGHD